VLTGQEPDTDCDAHCGGCQIGNVGETSRQGITEDAEHLPKARRAIRLFDFWNWKRQ